MQLFDIWTTGARQWTGLLAGALLSLSAATASAAVPGVNFQSQDTGPGEVELTVRFDVGSGYTFESLNFYLDYDVSVLQWTGFKDLAFEGAPPASLPIFEASEGPQGLSFSAIAAPVFSVDGITVKAGFKSLTPAAASVPFSFNGAAIGALEPLPADFSVSVSAVPEPETLMLWLGGMALLTTVARRRAKA